MANVQHSTLTDPNLHEPKGASTAAADQLYRSNGSGSGTWTNANRFPGTGWGQYRNATFVGTTFDAFTTTDKLLTFTEETLVDQLPISFAGTTFNQVNVSTDTLRFSATGDLYAITLTFEVYSTSGTPVSMDLHIYGSSDGTTYATNLGETTISLVKGAGQVITETSLFPVTANMVAHGARIFMRTNTGTVNIINIGLVTARVHKAR
jgi:hypothetical protein